MHQQAPISINKHHQECTPLKLVWSPEAPEADEVYEFHEVNKLFVLF